MDMLCTPENVTPPYEGSEFSRPSQQQKSGQRPRAAAPSTARLSLRSGPPNKPHKPETLPIDSHMINQPETRPIDQSLLVAEVKGIYDGLVMVETKCIEVDSTYIIQQESAEHQLSNEQWKALIALHRTLLHEHHDFFLASQHPSASPALRKLASKYAMPARMWRHGIHSFLELLRHRLPESSEHMLTFIYTAYSMMALLYETVPDFGDTWIECLGDLGRYRMAIDDNDIKDREVWTAVSLGWYSRITSAVKRMSRASAFQDSGTHRIWRLLLGASFLSLATAAPQIRETGEAASNSPAGTDAADLAFNLWWHLAVISVSSLWGVMAYFLNSSEVWHGVAMGGWTLFYLFRTFGPLGSLQEAARLDYFVRCSI